MLGHPPPLAAAAAASLVKFGRPTRTIESNPTTDATGGRLVKGDPDRVELTIVNLGTQTVFLSIRATVSTINGILIPPNGGMTVLVDEDGEMVAYEWFAVSSSGTQQLFVQEVLAE